MRVIGLDIGGTATRAVLSDGDREVQRATGPSANVAAVGRAAAAAALSAVLGRLELAGVVAVCAGSAGADTAQDLREVGDLLRERIPGARVRVVHDTELVLAAAGTATGIALIAGTGSVAWGRADDGRTARAGGWGHLLGDEGSAWAVGRAAVRHSLRLADAGTPPDDLTRALLSAHGHTGPLELVRDAYADGSAAPTARLAPVVFQLAAAGDPTAREILADAAEALVGLVRTVARRLGIAGPVVLSGGLVRHQPVVVDAVRSGLAAAALHDPTLLTREPVDGAVDLARDLARSVHRS